VLAIADLDLLDQLGLEDNHETGVEEAAERNDVAVATSLRVDEFEPGRG